MDLITKQCRRYFHCLITYKNFKYNFSLWITKLCAIVCNRPTSHPVLASPAILAEDTQKARSFRSVLSVCPSFRLFFLYCSLYSKVFKYRVSIYCILVNSFHFSLFIDYFTHPSSSSSSSSRLNSSNRSVNLALLTFHTFPYFY